jgi:nitrite reductase (NADH) small subunit
MPDGTQVALFRLTDGSVWAIGNVDPWSGAAVMSRGIVGDRAGRACVQSPIKKQAFAFDDGSCLDDDTVRVAVYRTRLTADGDVQVAAKCAA